MKLETTHAISNQNCFSSRVYNSPSLQGVAAHYMASREKKDFYISKKGGRSIYSLRWGGGGFHILPILTGLWLCRLVVNL